MASLLSLKRRSLNHTNGIAPHPHLDLVPDLWINLNPGQSLDVLQNRLNLLAETGLVGPGPGRETTMVKIHSPGPNSIPHRLDATMTGIS